MKKGKDGRERMRERKKERKKERGMNEKELREGKREGG